MKISLALAGAVLLGSSLAACGGGSDDNGGGGGGSDSAGSKGDYCKDIKSAKSTLGAVGGNNIDKLDDAFATFHDLADEAPDEVKGDWATLDTAVTKFETVLADAGIKVSDLDDIQAGKIPKGVDVAKLQSLGTELQDLGNAKFTAASDAITKHAKSACDVDIAGLS